MSTNIRKMKGKRLYYYLVVFNYNQQQSEGFEVATVTLALACFSLFIAGVSNGGSLLYHKITEKQRILKASSKQLSLDIVGIFDKYEILSALYQKNSLIETNLEEIDNLIKKHISSVERDQTENAVSKTILKKLTELIQKLKKSNINNRIIESILEKLTRYISQYHENGIINQQSITSLFSDLLSVKEDSADFNKTSKIISKTENEIKKTLNAALEAEKNKNIQKINKFSFYIKMSIDKLDVLFETVKKLEDDLTIDNKNSMSKYLLKFFISENLKKYRDIYVKYQNELDSFLLQEKEFSTQGVQKILDNLKEIEQKVLVENNQIKEKNKQLDSNRDTTLVHMLDANLSFAVKNKNITLPEKSDNQYLEKWAEEVSNKIVKKQESINKKINEYYITILKEITDTTYKNLSPPTTEKWYNKIFFNFFKKENLKYDINKYTMILDKRIRPVSNITHTENNITKTHKYIQQYKGLTNRSLVKKNETLEQEQTSNKDDDMLYLLRNAEEYLRDMKTLDKNRGFFTKVTEVYTILELAKDSNETFLYSNTHRKYQGKYEEIAGEIKSNTQNFLMIYLILQLSDHPDLDFNIFQNNPTINNLVLTEALREKKNVIYNTRNIEKMISILFKFHHLVLKKHGGKNFEKLDNINKIYQSWIDKNEVTTSDNKENTQLDPTEYIAVITDLFNFSDPFLNREEKIPFIEEVKDNTKENLKEFVGELSNMLESLPIPKK